VLLKFSGIHFDGRRRTSGAHSIWPPFSGRTHCPPSLDSRWNLSVGPKQISEFWLRSHVRHIWRAIVRGQMLAYHTKCSFRCLGNGKVSVPKDPSSGRRTSGRRTSGRRTFASRSKQRPPTFKELRPSTRRPLSGLCRLTKFRLFSQPLSFNTGDFTGTMSDSRWMQLFVEFLNLSLIVSVWMCLDRKQPSPQIFDDSRRGGDKIFNTARVLPDISRYFVNPFYRNMSGRSTKKIKINTKKREVRK